MIKIGLFLSSEPHRGGEFQYSQSILNACAALPARDYRPVAVYINRHWRTYLEETAIPSTFLPTGIWRLLARKRLSTLLPLPWWRRISPSIYPPSRAMKKLDCRLWIFPAQDTWTYLCPFPALGTVYDLMHRYEPRFPEVSSWGIYHNREQHYQKLCGWAKGVLVDSDVGKRQLMESYQTPAEKIHILPYVASHTSPTDDSALSPDLRLPDKFLFYPAQFWRHKNHHGLVQAVHDLHGEIPDLKLVLTGSENAAAEELKKDIRRLDLQHHIQFLGYVPDRAMPALYRRARGLIMPTFFGPTNIPPLEAMAAGCPVAVSDIYGMREQLGNAALFFNPSSIFEIAKAMLSLWKDDALCHELAGRGLDHHRQWNQEHFNTRFLAILDAVTQND